jgi:hypothetical protein
MSTGNFINSDRYCIYTDKIEVVEARTVETVKMYLCYIHSLLSALATTIMSTGNCINSHRNRIYTDKIEVVEGRTVETVKMYLLYIHSLLSAAMTSRTTSTHIPSSPFFYVHMFVRM